MFIIVDIEFIFLIRNLLVIFRTRFFCEVKIKVEFCCCFYIFLFGEEEDFIKFIRESGFKVFSLG